MTPQSVRRRCTRPATPGLVGVATIRWSLPPLVAIAAPAASQFPIWPEITIAGSFFSRMGPRTSGQVQTKSGSRAGIRTASTKATAACRNDARAIPIAAFSSSSGNARATLAHATRRCLENTCHPVFDILFAHFPTSSGGAALILVTRYLATRLSICLADMLIERLVGTRTIPVFLFPARQRSPVAPPSYSKGQEEEPRDKNRPNPHVIRQSDKYVRIPRGP